MRLPIANAKTFRTVNASASTLVTPFAGNCLHLGSHKIVCPDSVPRLVPKYNIDSNSFGDLRPEVRFHLPLHSHERSQSTCDAQHLCGNRPNLALSPVVGVLPATDDANSKKRHLLQSGTSKKDTRAPFGAQVDSETRKVRVAEAPSPASPGVGTREKRNPASKSHDGRWPKRREPPPKKAGLP